MKVLFLSYPHVGLGNGGMYRQIMQTKKELENIGVQVDVHSFLNNDISQYDICHVFATSESCYGVVRNCKNKGIPVVLSTVFSSFGRSALKITAEKILAKYMPGFLGSLKVTYNIIDLADQIIALNDKEVNLLNNYFDNINEKVIIVANGIDTNMIDKELNHKTSNLVLNVGLLHEIKNQYNLICAAENARWDLAIVGKIGDDNYSKKCVAKAEKLENVHLYGALEYGSGQLKDLYRKARVFCLPSTTEVSPLTLLEAAGHNCQIVASNAFPVPELLVNAVHYVDPHSIKSIRAGIDESFLQNVDTWNLIRTEPTWADIAKTINSIYEKLVITKK